MQNLPNEGVLGQLHERLTPHLTSTRQIYNGMSRFCPLMGAAVERASPPLSIDKGRGHEDRLGL